MDVANAETEAERKARLRRLAGEAWGHVEGQVRGMERRYPDIDWSGPIAERIVSLIGTFDPGRGIPLEKWAGHQAGFAIRDVWRNIRPLGFRRSKSRRPSRPVALVSFDALAFEPDFLAREDPTPAFELAEGAGHMLRGLRPDERAVVWGSIVEGRTLAAIASDLGVHDSRACQLRQQALEWLREAGRTA